MCPACIATATLIVAGVTSAGGLTALAMKKLRAKTAKSIDSTIHTGGGQDGSSKNRVAR